MEWRLKGDGKRAEFRELIILSALNRSLSILAQSYGSMHPSRIFLTFFLASFLVILLLSFCPRQVFSFIDLSDSPVSRFLARSSPPAYFAFPPSPSSVLVVLVRFRCRFDRLVHPSLSLSLSLLLLLPPSLPPFLLTVPTCSLFSTPFFPFLVRPCTFVVRLDTNDRKKESRNGNVVGRTVERLYRRFVHADYRFHATRGRLLLPPLTPTCKPAMCTSLWKVTSFLSWHHAALSLR